MPAHHSKQRTTDAAISERAIIHQLLRDDHTERWSPKQIARELRLDRPEAINDAVIRLEASGVIWRLDEYIGASSCTRYLFALDLIGI